MDGGCGGHEGHAAGSRVTVRGRVVRRPRGIRTAEGWELASLVLGSGGARREGDVVLVVCAGPGAVGAVTRLEAGDEVIALGRLVPRRAARPVDDAIEVVAEALVARRGEEPAVPAAEPRIAP